MWTRPGTTRSRANAASGAAAPISLVLQPTAPPAAVIVRLHVYGATGAPQYEEGGWGDPYTARQPSE